MLGYPTPPAFTKLASAWNDLPANVRGALLVSAGASFLALMAGLGKFLSETLPVPEIVFARFLAGFVVMLPVVWRYGLPILHTRKLPLHALRGAVGVIGNMALFFAIANMAIGDAVTIQFSRPLFMVAIAAFFLGEKVTLPRVIMAVVGFIGLVMITRPFGDGFEPWALVAVGGAISGIVVALAIRALTRTEQTVTIMFYFMLFTTVLSAIPAFIVWETPTLIELLLLILAGTLGVVGQTMFTRGIAVGDTSFVLPFDYLRIVFAFVMGVIWFAEVPVLWSIAGAATIVLSSIYLLQTERRPRGKKDGA